MIAQLFRPKTLVVLLVVFLLGWVALTPAMLEAVDNLPSSSATASSQTLPAYVYSDVQTIDSLLVLSSAADGSLYLKEHAGLHGLDAEFARQCLSNSQGYYLFFSEKKNRYAIVCWNEQIEKWGMVILEKIQDGWDEVTSFLKNKMKNYSQVERYMSNQGYVPVNR